jgi:transposase
MEGRSEALWSRTKGGLNSKLHVVCDGDGKPLAMLLSEGQMSDHPKQIKQWRDQLLEGLTGIFGKAGKAEAALVIDVKSLHAKIGELTLENDFLSGALDKVGLLTSAKR